MPQVSSEIKTALGDAPYTVAPDGNPVVDLGDTQTVESIELVNVTQATTTDGLVKKITYGYEKKADGTLGSRIVYSEQAKAWLRELDISGATLDKPMEISTYLGENAPALNTLLAFYYSEHDPIPAGAVRPNYFLNYSTNNITLGSQESGALKPEYEPNQVPSTKFSKSTQFFTEPKLLSYTDKSGQGFVIAVNNNRNPEKGNEKQTITLQKEMSLERYNDYMSIMNNKNIPILREFLSDNSKEATFLLIPLPTIMVDGNTYNIPWDAGTWKDPFGKGFNDVVAAKKQNRGELLALFASSEQKALNKIISMFNGGPVSLTSGGVPVDHIPVGLAEHRLLLDFVNYTNPPGDN